MIDLTNAKENSFKAYDGANGKKKCLIYNNEEYMLVISKANVYSDGSIYTYEYTLMAKDKARKAKK